MNEICHEIKEKRVGYVSAEQKNKLTTLNGIPGGTKNWTQWRKTWQDMRSKVKSKQATIKRHAYGIGGGPPLVTKLNRNEEDILSLISNVAVNGHSSVQESAVHFDFKNADEPNIVPIIVDTPQPHLVNNDEVIDHDYCENNVDNDSVKEIIVLEALQIPDMQETKNIPPNEPIVAQGLLATSRVKKHTVSSARKLEVAASAAELLNETAKEKLKMKTEYYKRKLEIMEGAENRKRSYHNRILEIKDEKLVIEERKARALEKICENLKPQNVNDICYILFLLRMTRSITPFHLAQTN